MSAAASNPVKHHAPSKIDNANDFNVKSDILRLFKLFKISKSLFLNKKYPKNIIKMKTPIISVITPKLFILETKFIPFK